MGHAARRDDPEDITAAIPHILSDGFAWATGSLIEVSGGQGL